MSRAATGPRRSFLLGLLLLPGPVLVCCDHPDYLVKSIQDQKLPLIRSIAPSIAVPDEVVEIQGSGFGSRPGQIYLTDGRELTVGPLAIESWGDDTIQARIPAQVPLGFVGLVKLATADSRALAVSPTVRLVGPVPR